MPLQDITPLFAADEPSPVIERNHDGAAPFFLTCDHYGRMIPRALGDLGLDDTERQRHIAWDIGIAGVAEAVSDALGAHLIAQRYSRLVIDCNRPPSVASSIPPISEVTEIPGNQGIAQDAADERRRSIYVLKSRGMAHSNAIREFRITDRGIDIQPSHAVAAGGR